MLDRRFLDVNLVVQGIADLPSGTPTVGTQYIVGSEPTGAFSSAEEGQIARYNGDAWQFSTPKEGGLEVFNAETSELLTYDGSTWSVAARLGGSGGDTSFCVVDGIVISGSEPPNENTYAYGTIFIGTNANDGLPAQLDYDYSGWHYGQQPAGSKFVSKSDGKIYTIEYVKETYKDGNYATLPGTALSNGSLIYDKTTKAFYSYENNTLKKIAPTLIQPIDCFVDFVMRVYQDYPIGYTPTTGTTGVITESDYIQRYNGSEYVNDTQITVGMRIATRLEDSTNLCRIYECVNADTTDIRAYSLKNVKLINITPEVDDMFVNKADGLMYVYNGTDFVAVGGGSSTPAASEVIAPVLGIVATGTDLPATAATGDKFLKTDDAKLYTATAANTWNAGVATANGDRYASSTDHKIYESDGSAITASDVPDGGIFLNKADLYVYVYDSKVGAFTKASADEITVNETVVEYHTLTALEATAKSFTLTNNIMSGKENNVLLSVCGITQIYNTDYSASGNTVTWDSKGLEDVGLRTGDVFVIHYIKA